MKATQIEADEKEKAAIEAYERWQGWAQESALRDIERDLRWEGLSSSGGHSAFPTAAGWAIACLGGALFYGGALWLLWWWLR